MIRLLIKSIVLPVLFCLILFLIIVGPLSLVGRFFHSYSTMLEWGKNVGEPLYFSIVLFSGIPAFLHCLKFKWLPNYYWKFVIFLPIIALCQAFFSILQFPILGGDLFLTITTWLSAGCLWIMGKYVFVEPKVLSEKEKIIFYRYILPPFALMSSALFLYIFLYPLQGLGLLNQKFITTHYVLRHETTTYSPNRTMNWLIVGISASKTNKEVVLNKVLVKDQKKYPIGSKVKYIYYHSWPQEIKSIGVPIQDISPQKGE